MNYKATLLNASDIERALKRISHEILEKNQGAENICLIGVKSRGVPLARKIALNIESIEGTKVPVGSIDITFYRDDLDNFDSDPVVNSSDIPFDIVGKKIILVDDVLHTGRTARAAMEAVIRKGRPAAIQLAILIDRGHRELPIRGDYIGKNVPTSNTERVWVKLPPFEDVTAVEIYDI